MQIRATAITFVALLVASGCGAAAPDASETAAASRQPAPTGTSSPFAAATVQPTVASTPTPTPTVAPTPTPTPEPTPKPTKVEYAKLSDRAWAKLVKAPDSYFLETYQVWACISQFDAATGLDTFRAQASNKKRTYWYTDGDNALFTGDEDRLADFVEEDMVVMNVTSLGSLSYDTQVGGNTTVPLFEVEKITRKGSCD